MKTSQILNIHTALSKLFQIDEKTPLNLTGVDRMTLATTAIKISGIASAYEKTRIGLARKAGLGPDNQVLPEKREEFFAALQPVLESEEEIKITPLKMEVMANSGPVPLSLLAELFFAGIIEE